jgi:hypothetical protein
LHGVLTNYIDEAVGDGVGLQPVYCIVQIDLTRRKQQCTGFGAGDEDLERINGWRQQDGVAARS